MPEQKLEPVVLEGRRILFRNFSGEEGRFNAAGDRNFNVLLEDEDEAQAMKADGWNVKWPKLREGQEEPLPPVLKVKVRYGTRGQPPRVILITSRGKTPLDESMVSILDWADIINVDMIIRPYSWDINGNQGTTAYLKSIYVTIREDELELKYNDMPDAPDSAASSITANATPHEEAPE